MKGKNAFILMALLAVVLAIPISVTAQAGQPSPAPTPAASPAPSPAPTPYYPGGSAQPYIPAESVKWGNYTVISSVELGVRGLSVDGNDDKYRSDLDYEPGFRIFDSSFLARSNEKSGGLFDTLMINSAGWDADPSGYLRISAESSKWYRFDANIRRNIYDNQLANLALGQHGTHTKHKFSDFDLHLLPHNRKANFSIGYSLDRSNGPGTTTYDLQNDEYETNVNHRTSSDEYRATGEFRFGGLDLGILGGLRNFKDDSTFSSGPNIGNSTTNTAVLLSSIRDQPTRGRIWFTRVSAHTVLAKKIDITGRYTYTKSTSDFAFAETNIGTNKSSQIYNPDRFNFPGRTERPNHLADFGLTWMPNDKLRISETFRYNSFHNDGNLIFNEFLALFTSTGAPVSKTTTVVPTNWILDYSRYYNQIEADYQFNPKISVHFGHRYTHRHIEELEMGNSSDIGAAFLEDSIFNGKSNTFFAGLKARPEKWWTLYFDIDDGDADDVFTRVDATHAFNFRIRNRVQPNPKLSLNLSYVFHNNNNPGESVTDNTLVGPLKATDFDVSIKNRIFNGSVDWVPGPRFTLSTGYTYTEITSDAAILFFAGLPSPNPAQAGRSQYYMRDDFFFANANIELFKRLSLFLSYRIHHDAGQGNRVSTPANGIFVGGIPLSYQTPEARLIFRITRRLDWNVGYQYFDYNERLVNNQDYRAHLPYTSLRLYFGGPDH